MNTTAQVKQAIKKPSKQIKREPIEILQNARQQITGDELSWDGEAGGEEKSQDSGGGEKQIQEEQKLKEQVAFQDGRRLEALETELRDIRRLKIYSELMKKIQNGEDIPIEEFQELTSEQREVLKAQMEAIKKQKINEQNLQTGLVVPTSKPGRQMRSGQKQSAQQQTTHVEKPVQSST